MKFYATALAPSGLRPVEFALLNEIDFRDGPSLTELAEAFQFDRSSLRYKLQPIERQGLIETCPSARDGRSRFVRLTDLGRAKLVEAMPFWHHAQKSFQHTLGDESATTLRANTNMLASIRFAQSPEASEP